MNRDDIAALADLLIRARQVVSHIKLLAMIPPQSEIRDVRAELIAVENDLANFTTIYQRRIAVPRRAERKLAEWPSASRS